MLSQEEITRRLVNSGALIFGDYDKENFTCYRCRGRFNYTSLKERIERGDVRRILIKGRMRTFHKKCFKLYAEENPNWFREN